MPQSYNYSQTGFDARGDHCGQFMLLLVLLCLLLAMPAGSARADELKLFTWEDYLSEHLLEAWEARSGTRVQQVFYDSDEKRDAVLGSSSAGVFDLLIVDGESGKLMGDNQILVPLTPAQVPNLRHIDKRWSESCGGYGLPYSWGTLGLVYRKDQFDSPPASWAELLDPQPAHQGHVVMHRDRIDTLIPPLALLGFDLHTENREELREAFALLKRQSPHVLSYDYVLTVAKKKAMREQIHLALAYSGDQDTLNDLEGRERWSYVIPSEGTAIWVDCIAVMATSKNREGAFGFINFLGEPANAARTVADVFVPSPNREAAQLLPPELRNDPTLFPDLSALNKQSQLYRSISAQSMLLRYRIVNAIARPNEAE